MRIMVIDDEKILSQQLKIKLQRSGYEVSLVKSYSDFKKQDNLNNIDLFLIDISLGDGNGIDIVKQLKKSNKTKSTPVIFISGHTELSLKIEGLDSGGDDYIMKPFELDELLARIRSNLRKTHPDLNTSTLKYKNIVFETANRSVQIGGKEISLSKKEKQILEHMMLHQNICISKDDLQKMFWKNANNKIIPENTINVTICNLRKKLGNELELKTIVGEGYCLQ